MIMTPFGAGARDFAIDWFLDDMARGRLAPDDAGEMLAQLRLAGDVANLERLSRAVAAAREADGAVKRGA